MASRAGPTAPNRHTNPSWARTLDAAARIATLAAAAEQHHDDTAALAAQLAHIKAALA